MRGKSAISRRGDMCTCGVYLQARMEANAEFMLGSTAGSARWRGRPTRPLGVGTMVKDDTTAAGIAEVSSGQRSAVLSAMTGALPIPCRGTNVAF